MHHSTRRRARSGKLRHKRIPSCSCCIISCSGGPTRAHSCRKCVQHTTERWCPPTTWACTENCEEETARRKLRGGNCEEETAKTRKNAPPGCTGGAFLQCVLRRLEPIAYGVDSAADEIGTCTEHVASGFDDAVHDTAAALPAAAPLAATSAALATTTSRALLCSFRGGCCCRGAFAATATRTTTALRACAGGLAATLGSACATLRTLARAF